MAEDDLDDFFEEIEEVEAEVIKDEEDDVVDVKDEPSIPQHQQLDDVEDTQHQQEVSSERNVDGNDGEEPPKKRSKKSGTSSSVPVRPRGVVVAASSSVVVKHNKLPTPTNNGSDIGPSIPPTNPVTAMGTMPSSINNTGLGYSGTHHQPPLPLGPPPPPPPLPNPTSIVNGSSATTGDGGGTATNIIKPVKRVAAGKVWVDTTLSEWPENDFRIFVGNLSRDVTDIQLYDHFHKLYPSVAMAKIVKDNKTGVSKGFGFVSFLQPLDCAKAIREQDQKWLGSRPIRVKRSDWKERNFNEMEKKKRKDAKVQKQRFGGGGGY